MAAFVFILLVVIDGARERTRTRRKRANPRPAPDAPGLIPHLLPLKIIPSAVSSCRESLEHEIKAARFGCTEGYGIAESHQIFKALQARASGALMVK